MDKKLTDSEIVKALKEILELMLCEGDLQRTSTISHAIDLINRLQAANEGLQQKINGFEKIRRAYQRFIHENMPYIQNSLDNLLKELIGE